MGIDAYGFDSIALSNRDKRPTVRLAKDEVYLLPQEILEAGSIDLTGVFSKQITWSPIWMLLCANRLENEATYYIDQWGAQKYCSKLLVNLVDKYARSKERPAFYGLDDTSLTNDPVVNAELEILIEERNRQLKALEQVLARVVDLTYPNQTSRSTFRFFQPRHSGRE